MSSRGRGSFQFQFVYATAALRCPSRRQPGLGLPPSAKHVGGPRWAASAWQHFGNI
jgi:hypothetical protein